jgi:negative regulator of sigma-B (phosphoserine phosphatase)
LKVQTAQISLPMPGEHKNGDAVLVRETPTGAVMLAVIDGLGHGPDAAAASQAAVTSLNALPFDSNVTDAMREMHERLRGTRGAAATLCILRGSVLEACAVGNVALLTTSCSIPLVLSAGVLGHQVAKFRVCSAQVKAGARLALLSDGISTRFRLEELRQLDAEGACREIMARYRRKEDDASVLMADVAD